MQNDPLSVRVTSEVWLTDPIHLEIHLEFVFYRNIQATFSHLRLVAHGCPRSGPVHRQRSWQTRCHWPDWPTNCTRRRYAGTHSEFLFCRNDRRPSIRWNVLWEETQTRSNTWINTQMKHFSRGDGSSISDYFTHLSTSWRITCSSFPEKQQTDKLDHKTKVHRIVALLRSLTSGLECMTTLALGGG